MKINKKEYDFICSLIWGGSPVDILWATESKIYTEKSKEILEKYPKLDFDFFEENKKVKT